MPNWWPFGRKRRKNKKEGKAAKEAKVTHELEALEKPRAELPATHPIPVKSNDEPPTHSLGEKEPFDPRSHTGEQPLSVEDHHESAEDITALPSRVRDIERSPHLRPVNDSGLQYSPSVRSRRSITQEPSLRRSNSSKKRNYDPYRESQIKALSSPIPIPNDTRGLSSRKSRRERNLGADASMISLPQAGSIRSSVTVASDNHYEVGPLDLFSARPRIRTSLHSQHVGSPALRSAAASRNDSKYEQDASPRRVLRESKTIDNLVDHYDASTLRELMDRDYKRRERKRQAQEDRARRRLESYFEGQEAAGPSTRKSRPRTPRRDKGKRDDQEENRLGLRGVAAELPGTSKATEDKPRDLNTTEGPRDLPQRDPFNDPDSPVTTPLKEPVIETAKALHVTRTDMSPPSSPGPLARPTSNLSQITDPRHSSPTTTASTAAEPERKGSEPSVRKGPLAALFRRSNRQLDEPKQRDSAEGTSFKNTSRESMSRQLPPAHLREQPSIPRARSGTPTRTMSKFREDLPEATASPPESRVQSPDIAEVLEPPAATNLSARQREKLPESSVAQGQRAIALSRTESPSIGVLSQSLASVDSEGSWLSGKPTKRASTQMNPGALEQLSDIGTASFENLGATDEEYFRRHATRPNLQGTSGISAAMTNRSSPTKAGQKEGFERMGEVARTPTLVLHQQRAKSSEGLLKQMADDENDSVTTSPVDQTLQEETEEESEEDESPIVAESPKMLTLGHARSISRGSATLLDIPAHKGTRTSYASGQSRTTPPPT